ncbi:hypothetical protein V8D89_003669 [Ganoderma adspersum]
MNMPRFLHFMHDPRTRAAARRRHFYDIPDEGDNATYTNCQRDAILALVNSVFHVGHRDVFSRLASLLAPGCEPVYLTEASAQAFQPRVLFLWKPIPLAARRELGAQFSVFFYIDTAPPLSVAHLTFTLLHFTYLATHAYVTADYNFNPRRLPRMTHLAYNLSATSVYGIAYFDNLHYAFADASTHGVQVIPSYPRPPTVITAWPPDIDQLLLWAQHHNFGLLAHCNELIRMLSDI